MLSKIFSQQIELLEKNIIIQKYWIMHGNRINSGN